ncbi:MAG: hypothetical protein NC048_05580 [Bacteroides sp.]|nr:hypothetical protein [Ruminococcus flavefaciens]MCM1531065.1 hypothetical protein [Ruminococcus flavefaciens]MCM1554946.1 hypothetical protein [Bacteroides sp.]
MEKTGIKIKRCNVGSVEDHNKRTEQYLDGLEKAEKRLYFFPDLTSNNVSWENPRYNGKSCQTLFNEAITLYKEKVGQAPQLKDRDKINKKTGKKTTIAGWSPIREGCSPIKEDTSIEDFKPVVDWARGNGLDVIRIDLHFDEGHIDAKTKERKLNRHAHIVFDWVDHDTGRSIKLDEKKMSELQDVMAIALGMERGTPKSETGLEHIPAAEYREMKATEETQRLEREAEELKQNNQWLEKKLEAVKEEAKKELAQIKQETDRLGLKNSPLGGPTNKKQRETIGKLIQEQAALQQEHEQEKAAMREEHKREMAAMQEKHVQEIGVYKNLIRRAEGFLGMSLSEFCKKAGERLRKTLAERKTQVQAQAKHRGLGM